MNGNEKPPIIIKRKKVVAGDGHHGGAWKVAKVSSFVSAALCAGFANRLFGGEKSHSGSCATGGAAPRAVPSQGAPEP